MTINARSVLLMFMLLVTAVLGGLLAQCAGQHAGIVYAAADPAAGGVQVFLAWLNSPMVKTVVVLLGGFVLRQWAPFVNKAIPFTLALLSGVVQTVHMAFPDIGGAIQPAAYMAAAFSTSAGFGGWLFGSLVPVLLAVGINSGQKNVAEWSRIGFKLLH